MQSIKKSIEIRSLSLFHLPPCTHVPTGRRRKNGPNQPRFMGSCHETRGTQRHTRTPDTIKEKHSSNLLNLTVGSIHPIHPSYPSTLSTGKGTHERYHIIRFHVRQAQTRLQQNTKQEMESSSKYLFPIYYWIIQSIS